MVHKFAGLKQGTSLYTGNVRETNRVKWDHHRIIQIPIGDPNPWHTKNLLCPEIPKQTTYKFQNSIMFTSSYNKDAQHFRMLSKNMMSTSCSSYNCSSLSCGARRPWPHLRLYPKTWPRGAGANIPRSLGTIPINL